LETPMGTIGCEGTPLTRGKTEATGDKLAVLAVGVCSLTERQKLIRVHRAVGSYDTLEAGGFHKGATGPPLVVFSFRRYPVSLWRKQREMG
jgi:hypothetical protein